MACKYFGPGWFIPATSLAFGLFSICTAFVHHLSAACAVRFLLGLAESGVLPGIAYYMSRWVSASWSSRILSQAVSSLVFVKIVG